MKRCTWCGKEVSDEVTACPIDGRTVVEVKAPAATSVSAGEKPLPADASQAVLPTVTWNYTKISIFLALLGSVVAMFFLVMNVPSAPFGTSSLAVFTSLMVASPLCLLSFFHAQSRRRSGVSTAAGAAALGAALSVVVSLVQSRPGQSLAIAEMARYSVVVTPVLYGWFFFATAREDASLRVPAYAALVGASIILICTIIALLAGTSNHLESGLLRLLGFSLNMTAQFCYVVFFSVLAGRQSLPSITLYGTWAAVGGLLTPLGAVLATELRSGRRLPDDRLMLLTLLGIAFGISLARACFVRKAK